MLAKFGLPFDKATPLVHFPKALKRTRNNAGPASNNNNDDDNNNTSRTRGIPRTFKAFWKGY